MTGARHKANKIKVSIMGIEIKGMGDMPEELKEALSGLFEKFENRSEGKSTATPLELQARAALYNDAHTFAPGDLVEWKPGLRHQKWDDVFVVVEVLSETIYPPASDKHGSGSPSFREPLNIKLARIHADGDFMIYHYDSKRFQPHTLEEKEVTQ